MAAPKFPAVCVKLDPTVLARPEAVAGKVAWAMRHHSVPAAEVEAATGEIIALSCAGRNAMIEAVLRWVDVKDVEALLAPVARRVTMDDGSVVEVPAGCVVLDDGTLIAATPVKTAPAVVEAKTMAKKATKAPAPKTTKTATAPKRLTPDSVIALCREVREVVDANGSIGLQSLWASLTTTAGVKDHAWEITKAELKSAIKAAGRGQGVRLSGTGNGDDRRVVKA